MARFEIGTTLPTTEPFIVVDAGLPSGRHRFQLVVEDEAGNQSRPDQVIVTLVARTGPILTGPILTRPTLSTTSATTTLRPRARSKSRRGPR